MEEAELRRVMGGGISVWGVAGIISLVVFLTGIIDGVVNPNKCAGA